MTIPTTYTEAYRALLRAWSEAYDSGDRATCQALQDATLYLMAKQESAQAEAEAQAEQLKRDELSSIKWERERD